MPFGQRWMPPRMVDTAVRESLLSLARFLNTRIIGISGSVTPNPPAIEKATFVWQVGRLTVSIGGGAPSPVITFPTPFPNGLVAVWLTMASQPANPHDVSLVTTTTTQFSVNSTGAVTEGVTVGWLALGW